MLKTKNPVRDSKHGQNNCLTCTHWEVLSDHTEMLGIPYNEALGWCLEFNQEVYCTDQYNVCDEYKSGF